MTITAKQAAEITMHVASEIGSPVSGWMRENAPAVILAEWTRAVIDCYCATTAQPANGAGVPRIGPDAPPYQTYDIVHY